MIQQELFTAGERPMRLDLPEVLERLAAVSSRPRYAFMVFNLIATAAAGTGRAGPYVCDHGEAVPVRDWLCDALTPIAQRDRRRLALVDGVVADLRSAGGLPEDPGQAKRTIEEEVRARIRQAGRANVSRAVSELVKAGLVRRHYQGYRVDHHNRGAQRQAVYQLTPEARTALAGR